MTKQEAIDALKAAGADDVRFAHDYGILSGVAVEVGGRRNAMKSKLRGSEFDLKQATAVLRSWVQEHVVGKPLGPDAFGGSGGRS